MVVNLMRENPAVAVGWPEGSSVTNRDALHFSGRTEGTEGAQENARSSIVGSRKRPRDVYYTSTLKLEASPLLFRTITQNG